MAAAAVPGRGVEARRTRRGREGSRTRAALLALEGFISVTALVGGTLLFLVPDGTLLAADSAVLSGSPFEDWRLPGMLLALLVGVGFAVASWTLWSCTRWARQLSAAAGLGLVAFEVVELAWLGFHPLQVVMGLMGVVVLILAVRLPRQRQTEPGPHAARQW